MKRLVETAMAEITVKRSRFISIACRVTTLEEVREKVNETRLSYPDCTHVVHAAVVGKNGTLWSSSDDREPKNTAGRPALEVLKGSGITDICVCIVRYFGGTLLGTGGLVKAYGDSVREVLKAAVTEENIEYSPLTLTLGYELYNPLKLILERNGCRDTKEEFAVGIRIHTSCPSSGIATLRKEIGDLGQGRIQLDIQ